MPMHCQYGHNRLEGRYIPAGFQLITPLKREDSCSSVQWSSEAIGGADNCVGGVYMATASSSMSGVEAARKMPFPLLVFKGIVSE